MAASPIVSKLSGLAELRQALLGLPPRLRRRALRNSLAAGARVFRDEAKRLAPVLAALQASPRRKPGTLRRAIRVRTSKLARRNGDVGVFVNVRPAKGADRGGKNPNDPFYWRFVEFGTNKMAARPYLRPAANSKSGEAIKRIEATLGPAIAKLNVKGGGA